MAEDVEKEKKLTSRKFIVWIVWLVLTVAIVVLNYIFGSRDDLTLEIIKDFFGITMLYLGCNVAQKGIYSWCDKQKEEKETNEQ